MGSRRSAGIPPAPIRRGAFANKCTNKFTGTAWFDPSKEIAAECHNKGNPICLRLAIYRTGRRLVQVTPCNRKLYRISLFNQETKLDRQK
jgi:hypothetical protein